MNAELKLSKTKHFAIAVLAIATAFSMMPRQIFAEGIEDPIIVKNLTPKRVFLFNDNPELNSTTEVTVASLSYKSSKRHRLVIDYSSVGAIRADDAANPALLFIGCFVDGNPCIGSQANPPNPDLGPPVPEGFVNVLSCDFPTCAGWDNSVSHVWFSQELTAGLHTVEIKAAVGNPLIPFMGTGTLFDEARNLIVTLLSRSEEEE